MTSLTHAHKLVCVNLVISLLLCLLSSLVHPQRYTEVLSPLGYALFSNRLEVISTSDMPRGRPVGRGGGGRGQGRGNAPIAPPPLHDEHSQVGATAKTFIPMFDPDNYHTWAHSMKSFLSAEGCFGAIDEASGGWANLDDNQQTRLKLQAFNFLRVALGSVHNYIVAQFEVDKAKPLWDRLRAMYVRSDMDTRLTLENRFQALCWDRTRHHVDSFLADLTSIQTEFRAGGFELKDEMVFTKLLRCLPEQFAIEKGKMRDWEQPDLARARMTLKVREEELSSQREFESSQPLLEGSNFYVGDDTPSHPSSSHHRTFPTTGNGAPIRCYYCKHLGHTRFQCEKLRRKREKAVGLRDFNTGQNGNSASNNNPSSTPASQRGARGARGMRSRGRRGGHVSLIRYQDTDHADSFEWDDGTSNTQGFILASYNAASVDPNEIEIGFCSMLTNEAQKGWILDTGATHHLCKNREFLSDLKEAEVNLETGKAEAVLEASAYGSVTFDPIEEGYQPVTLQKVLFTPDASSNIIALKPFAEVGCTIEIEGDGLTIYRGNAALLTGKSGQKGLYIIDSHAARNVGAACFSLNHMAKTDTMRLIHNRLCHLHPEAIKRMIREKMVHGLPEDLDLSDTPLNCPSCVSGKMARQPYPQKNTLAVSTSQEVGDEVCSDTFGPLQPPSRYGNTHVAEFIDKASAFAFLFGIPSLDMVVSKYILVRNIFDTQLKTKIKVFRSDGHRCYDNSEFKTALARDGTLHKIRSPYCPEQNAVAERRVRTIVEMARTMMIHACVPSYCWEDAVLHANHVRNRVATRALKGMTPFEMFWKKKPDLQWLKPFGCLVYVLIHKEIRDAKFDAVAMPGVLMGVSEVHSGYKVHMLQSGSIKVARDVRFYEDIYPFRKSPSTDLQWMNPLDCPRPTADVSSVGSFTDPFVQLDQVSTKARRDANLADLYQRKVVTLVQAPVAKRSRTGCGSSDTDGSSGTLLVTEGVETTTSTISESEIFAFGHQSVENPISKEVCEFIDGMVLSTVEMDMTSELDGPDRERWLEAFKVEYGAIMKTGTFAKMTPDASKMVREGKIKIHQTRPILSHKFNEAGEIARYKVRLVVKGFTMEKGVDYDKTFAPCARMTTVRMVVAYAVALGWNVTHSDVPNAYLNGKTPHLVVIKLPPMWTEIVGNEIGNNGDPAIMANSLYGAPDAGRNWNSTYTSFFLEEGYTQCVKEPCIFYKGQFPKIAIFVVWVDDNFATGGDTVELDRMHARLKERFNIKVLGRLSYALGIAFAWDQSGVKMTQTAFIDKIASRFRMDGATPSTLPVQAGFKPLKKMCPKDDTERDEMKKVPYRSAIGSLLYVALSTRPDIAYAVCSLARYNHDPGKAHWSAVKNVIKYLMHTRDMGLVYLSPSSQLQIQDLIPHGFSDASFNDSDDGRSTMGFVTMIHKYPIAWKSKVFKNVAQSTYEAEWVAMNTLTREIMWARYVSSLVLAPCPVASTVRIDNRACALCIDDRVTEANKHFRPKYFFVVRMSLKGEVSVVKVGTAENLADMMTKSLGHPAFDNHRLSVGVS